MLSVNLGEAEERGSGGSAHIPVVYFIAVTFTPNQHTVLQVMLTQIH